MDKPVIEHENLYNKLLQIDIEFALDTREKGCPYCGGVLHRANYPRVPKGLSGLFDISHVVRFSFCCSGDECRRRTTLPLYDFSAVSSIWAFWCYYCVRRDSLASNQSLEI